MSELPAGWSHIQLGEIIELKYGKALPAAERDGGAYPVYGSNGIIGYHSAHLTQGQTIIVGRKGSVGEVCYSPMPCCPIDTTYYIDSFETVEPNFLYYLLRFLDLHLLNRSTAIPGLNRQDAYGVSVAMPPSAEQHRIVQTLDTLLAQIDTLKARIDAIPAFVKRFRQAVRVVALTGELERGRLIDSEKWKSCVLSDIALVETGKTPDRSESKYWADGSIAWVTSAATGASTCEEAKEFVTPQAAKECSLKIFAPETLLLAMYGEGKTRGQVTELRIHAACNQACAAISVDRQLAELGFVKLRLEENYDAIRKMAVGGAQPNLNLGKVREIPISLPSKEIQADIVRRVNQLFAFADQLEAQVLAAKQRIDTLTQSLLAKAFRGELVPQDPSEEPASVLLERIRAQRAAVPKPKRGRKAASN